VREAFSTRIAPQHIGLGLRDSLERRTMISARTTQVAEPHGQAVMPRVRSSARTPPRCLAGRTEPHALPVRCKDRVLWVKIASERAEFEQAFQLLSEKYRARGYEPPSPKPFRFTPYHVLNQTQTLVAKYGERVVATFSLVPDNDSLGLPMENLYSEEIKALRRTGYRLAEVTSLADRDLASSDFLRVFRVLIKLAIQVHVHRGGDSWVIAIHPRHATFYRKILGFRKLGPRRDYSAVRGHPAEAYLLDVAGMRANTPNLYEELLGEPLSDDVLRTPRRSPEHVSYFGANSTVANRQTFEDILKVVGGEEDTGAWGVPEWAVAGPATIGSPC